MNAAERSRDVPGSTRDATLPASLAPLREERAMQDAERLTAAIAALERVRTQLARTQRTLDAFVAQITGTPDGTQARSTPPPAPASLPEPAPAPRAPAAAEPPRLRPPGALADHVLPPAELQPPPSPAIARAPMAPTVRAAPAVAPATRPTPPGALAGHMHAPGDRPAPAPAVPPADAADTATAPAAIHNAPAMGARGAAGTTALVDPAPAAADPAAAPADPDEPR